MASFLLFAGNDYYPTGGAEDLIGGFDSADAAQAAHDPTAFEYDGGWANILCLKTLTIVRSFIRGVWSDGPIGEWPLDKS